MLNLKISHKFTGISLFTLFALSVTGCGVITVDYKHDLQLPESYAGIRSAENNIQDLSKWWEVFNDPLLTELINKALKQNYNIRTAGLTLEKALHEANLAKADLGPSAALNANLFGAKSDAELPVKVPDINSASLGTAGGIEVSWELDLFGKKQSSLDAAKYRALSIRDQIYAAQTAIAAETALKYFEILAVKDQIRVLKANIENLEKLHKYVKGRFASGEATAYDVENTGNQITNLKSKLALLDTVITGNTRAIAVLCGETPQTFVHDKFPEGLPEVLPAVPLGSVPGELLLRRPDILAKDNEISAKAALTASAKADLYPRFNINFLGSAGRIEMDGKFDHISGWATILSGSVSLPVFTNGRIRANIEAKNADLKSSLAEYDQMTLQALKEVDNQYDYIYSIDKQKKLLEQGKKESNELITTATRLFEFGKTNFDSITTARARNLSFDDALIENRHNKIKAMIVLYKALGGGWNCDKCKIENGYQP